jgi:hypothetical protein
MLAELFLATFLIANPCAQGLGLMAIKVSIKHIITSNTLKLVNIFFIFPILSSL